MYALVMMVCYLNGSCENLYLGGFDTEEQCVRELKVQRIQRGGCLPLENVLDDFGNLQLAQPTSIAYFSHPQSGSTIHQFA